MQQSASVAGIQPSEFWQLSYRDLNNYLEGYRRKNIDDWKRTRLTAYMTYAVNVEAKEREPMTSWLPLEDEKATRKKRKLISKKEYQMLKQRWN